MLFSVSIPNVQGRGRRERTEDARHDGDARVLDLALRIVDAQGLEGGKADSLVTARHDCSVDILWRSN